MRTIFKTTAIASLIVMMGASASFAQATSGGSGGGTNASPSNQEPQGADRQPAGGPRARITGQVPGGEVYDGRPAIPAFGPIPSNAG